MASRILLSVLLFAAGLSGLAAREKDVTKLQIGVKFRPEKCEKKAHNGDKVKVHYRGKLTDGTIFDESYGRGTPFDFTLGKGMVIKGWDLGILGMCIGEKRKLKIPSDMGYGDRGSPPKIPAGATLIFDTELVDILGSEDDLDFPSPEEEEEEEELEEGEEGGGEEADE